MKDFLSLVPTGRYFFWRQKLKLSPLLFPGDSKIFKAIFLYRSTYLYRQLIPTKLILSPNLEEKILSQKQRDDGKMMEREERKERGEWENLFRELSNEDRQYYYRYLGVIPERFKHLFNLVGSLIAKQDTNQQTRSLTESCKMLLM